MIVCRQPCTIYDVDVIGVAALAVVALAICFGVILPAGANATEYQALSARIAAANVKLDQTSVKLQKVNAEISLLDQGVADRKRDAPKPGAQTVFLQRVARLAELCELELVQAVPQATRQADGYLVSDVMFTGRGSCPSFIRLLDHLARENPYHALQYFSIRRKPKDGDNRCELSWTLRLYMLEEDRPAPEGDTP